VLDMLAAHGLLSAEAYPGEYRVPGCLHAMLRSFLAAQERDDEIRLAKARMLERTVRLLAACRAALTGETGGDRAPAAKPSKAGARAAAPSPQVRFPTPQAAAAWLRHRLPCLVASARLAAHDGKLDTLARRLVAALLTVLTLPAGEEARAGSTAELYELH